MSEVHHCNTPPVVGSKACMMQQACLCFFIIWRALLKLDGLLQGYIPQIKFSYFLFRCISFQPLYVSVTVIALNMSVPGWAHLLFMTVITGAHSLPHKVLLMMLYKNTSVFLSTLGLKHLRSILTFFSGISHL